MTTPIGKADPARRPTDGTPGTVISSRLPAVMYADAAITAANGAIYVVAAGVLTGLLGPSSSVLIGIGLFLIVYALVVVMIARRRPLSIAAVREVALVNLVWVVASLVVAGGGLLALTGWGRLWAVLQALVVLGFAALQFLGTRRAAAR